MSLTNSEVAKVFSEMGDMLAILGTDHNRARAFRRIARILENLAEPLGSMVRNGRLIKVNGVGDGTVHRVKDILRTGTCDDHRELTQKLPKGLRELLKIRGLGTTKVRVIYQNLRVASLDELEAAARRGDLARLPRIGLDQQARLLKEIEAYRLRAGRMPLDEALLFGDRMKAHLLSESTVHAAELTGSGRRGESTVGDLDFVVATEDLEATVASFVSFPDASEVLMQARTRGSIRLRGSGRQADIWCVPPGSFGAGLHAFSGSLLHVINIRKRGNARKLKISETGVHNRLDGRLIDPGQTEADIFAAVGLPFITPELRQNVGEIELAERGRLPTLIEAADLIGDLHMHTTYSDGTASARAMADAAVALGLRYIAITDHSGPVAARLAEQARELKRIEASLGGALTILRGIEVDILPGGELSVDRELLRDLDWVVASVHGKFDMSQAEATDRLITAMESGVVDCIGHPTGRRLGRRDGYPLDLERVLQRAARLGVAVECNMNPGRLDLDGQGLKLAKDLGVAVSLNTDAHAPQELARRRTGLLTARRGWLTADEVLNTHPVERIREHRRARARPSALVPGATLPRVVSAPPEEPEDAGEPDADDTPEDVDALRAALAARPLPEDLLARVRAYLEKPDDAALDQALKELGDNPVQVAFNLLFGA